MTGAAPNTHSAAADEHRHELQVSGDLDLHTVPGIELTGTRALADPTVRTIAPSAPSPSTSAVSRSSTPPVSEVWSGSAWPPMNSENSWS